jgi:hypothetical protein
MTPDAYPLLSLAIFVLGGLLSVFFFLAALLSIFSGKAVAYLAASFVSGLVTVALGMMTMGASTWREREDWRAEAAAIETACKPQREALTAAQKYDHAQPVDWSAILLQVVYRQAQVTLCENEWLRQNRPQRVPCLVEPWQRGCEEQARRQRHLEQLASEVQ